VLPVRVAARLGYADLFKPPYLSLVVLFMVFNFCQAFGFYGFTNWVPTLLVEKGITVTKSLQYSFIVAFAYPIAPLLAAIFLDRFERNMTMSYAYHAYQTEVFPTSIRARASGLVYSMSRLSATFSGFIIAYVLREIGVGGIFGLITAAMIIVVIAITTWGPNVRGSSP
jgi:putative MFS transporter